MLVKVQSFQLALLERCGAGRKVEDTEDDHRNGKGRTMDAGDADA